MQLTYLIAWLLASPAWVCGQTVGHVTRDYFGDIFSLEDCEPCDESGRKAANIPGEKCRCQCAPSHYTFREDMKQCIKDVGECPVAMFVRPFAPPSLPPLGGFAERIPLVFLPMTGQLIHPGSYLTVSGITRLAPKHHLSCNVKASLLMTSHGWQPIRTPSEIFGVYYDGNKTFLQWLGDDEDRRHLQHHLVLIRLLCEGETSNGTFEPCAALRIGWAPGLEPELIDQSTNKNNFIIIGLCLGILGLIYVGAVLIYLKVRKNRRQLATRQGLAPSHNTIESAEEDSNSTQLRNAYINNLVQEAEFTTKSSPKGSSTHRPASDHDNGSSEGNHQSETSITQDTTHNKTNGKKCSHYENYSRTSADIPDDLIITSTQPPTQEFFVRIRGMISAAKNRLNSFRYRPTLLVIPEDDYFYQDFKERDEASGNRKTTFKKFNGKTTSSPITSKMESIHGSNLGAAMLEAKLAPPLPPPRNAKPKSKKRAPSPPGERISTPDYSRETSSPVSLKDFSNSMERKNGRITTVNSENYSKFDLFRLDLYEKINRMREGGSTENEIAVLEMNGELNRMKEDIYDAESASHHKADDRNGKEGSCRNLDYPPGIQDIKISRRQLLYKLETANMNGSDDEENDVESRAKAEFSNTKNGASNRSVKEDYEPDDDDDGVPSHVGSVIEDSVINEASITCSSRPGTAMSNSSARTTSSQPSTMKEKLLIRENSHPLIKRDDLSECSETSEASLSGDSLNSSFRKQVRSPSLLESRRSLKSTEDLSMISGSSVITSSTAIKEIEDYDDDDDDDEDPDVDEDDMTDITTQDDDSRFSTDLDAEIYSLDDSEHPSLEEYLQLSSQVAKKLSERTVPAFSNDSPREKNVISQFMKEFKTTIGRLKMAEDSKLRSMRTTSPGADNWTLKREETRAKVARRVSIFKRNPLKGRKNEEPLVTEDNGKSYYDMNLVSETDRDAASSRSSTASSLSGKRSKYKSKTPEIVPSAKVVDFTGDKTIISITNDTKGSIGLPERRENMEYTSSPTPKPSMPRVGKAVTPPLPPPKPQIDQLKMKIGTSHQVRTVPHEPTLKYETNSCIVTTDNGIPTENHKAASTLLKNTQKKRKGPERYMRTPSIESDSISVANSDMTEDSLNTPVLERASEEDNTEDISEDENSPIDRCLAQLADSVIQPTDDCSLNRYLSQLGTVLAAREDCPLDQCLNKLASNMNGNRATKGFNLSQHLPLCTWQHICVDKGSDRSTPTSDRSSTTSRGSKGSQENLRKKTLNKAKHHHHHHHHHRSVECKYNNGEVLQINNSLGNLTHQANGHVHTNINDEFTAHVLIERAAFKSMLRSKNQIASTSEEDECGRASSLGSTRELETPISETTSDPGSADLERPRKKRPLLRRSKKGLNGTCRQHIQNSKFNKKDNGSLKKGNFQQRNSSTPRSSSSDVTVIQLEGNSDNHVTNVESSNTFVTLINVDSSDCSNSAEEK